MRNVISLLFLSTLLFLSQPVHAEEPALTGLGASACSLYLEGLEKDEDLTRIGFQSWMQGYLSGKNYERIENDKEPVDIDQSFALWQVVTKYCELSPDHYYWLGVEFLWGVLKERQDIKD